MTEIYASNVARYYHPVSRNINHPALMVFENDFREWAKKAELFTFGVYLIYSIKLHCRILKQTKLMRHLSCQRQYEKYEHRRNVSNIIQI